MSSLARPPAQPAPPVAAPSPASAPAADVPAPPGSRWESAWVALQLAGDLLSTPFHLIAFLCTRGRQKQRLLDELRRSAE